MGDKKEDDEFVLQIAFTFHKFLLHDETRTALLSNTQVRTRGAQCGQRQRRGMPHPQAPGCAHTLNLCACAHHAHVPRSGVGAAGNN